MEKGQAQAQEVVTAPEDNTTTHGNATSKDNTTPDNMTIYEKNNYPNCVNVLNPTYIKAIESYLISSLKTMREENNRLAEQYRQLKHAYDVKMQEKLKSLNDININPLPNLRLMLKQIQVKQVTVLHHMKWMVDNETQIARAYDKHCRTAMDKTEKQYQLEKRQAYDEFTQMTSQELTQVINSCKDKIVGNVAEAKRLQSLLISVEETHKVELIHLRNSVLSLEDVLRETSQMCQDLEFEKNLRTHGKSPK